MRLYLMRHGIAIDREDPECPPESERYLTPKGIERTRMAAKGLRELNVKPSALLTSPYVRAVQTGEIVCEVLRLDPKQLLATDALRSDAKPARILDELSTLSDDTVICFGHAPHMDEIIAYALKAAAPMTRLKKAGVACLDIADFSPLQVNLDWLMTPWALRHLQD